MNTKSLQSIRVVLLVLILLFACNTHKKYTSDSSKWDIASQQDWINNMTNQSNLDIINGKAIPKSTEGTFQSVIKRFSKKRAVQSITISQSPDWLNWKQVNRVGPVNLKNAPVALHVGKGNYWMFGWYGQSESQKDGSFKGVDAKLNGFDMPLKTTPFKNQFDAQGGLKPSKGGYHAWQSKDMVNWVHHGAVSEEFSKWVTSAELVDGKLYLYYDFPNDQDPHLYIDDNLTDGLPGKNMGMAFNDPSNGSDSAIIRDLKGNFHLILEDWSPIDASNHSWDSPLAMHAVSKDGIKDFIIVEPPPVDERTKPTGKFAEYPHPYWYADDPTRFPGKLFKRGDSKPQMRAFGKYEIHEPEQNAFGDWAAISIGGQYYLFSDFEPAGKHGPENMSVAWFTSSDINKPFTFCGHIGKGHPDPDIMYAEGQFYLVTQTEYDFVSPGPWIDTVKVRMGVDTSNDGKINEWSDWHAVSEMYDYIEGFTKQIKKTPAQMTFPDLPEGYGFQFEVKIIDTTENESKPILDKVIVMFE